MATNPEPLRLDEVPGRAARWNWSTNDVISWPLHVSEFDGQAALVGEGVHSSNDPRAARSVIVTAQHAARYDLAQHDC